MNERRIKNLRNETVELPFHGARKKEVRADVGIKIMSLFGGKLSLIFSRDVQMVMSNRRMDLS